MSVLAISNLYHSFCLAPAPPPPPPPPTPPPLPPPPLRPAQDASSVTRLYADVGDADNAPRAAHLHRRLHALRSARALRAAAPVPHPRGGRRVAAARALHAVDERRASPAPCASSTSTSPSTPAAIRVDPGGTLTLAGGAQIDGLLENRGVVRYELPAPLGTHVSGGAVRSCTEEAGLCGNDGAATSLVELRGSPTAPEVVSGLPQPCPAGYLGSSADLAAQRRSTCARACPRGAYCPSGSVNATLCDAGSFNPATHGASRAACIGCDKGARCAEGATSPSPCPEGTYQDEPGRSSCNACPADKYCLGNGTVTPQDSPCRREPGVAEYEDAGECRLCPVAHSCDGRLQTGARPGRTAPRWARRGARAAPPAAT